jgi:hypothetical protein
MKIENQSGVSGCFSIVLILNIKRMAVPEQPE